MRAAVNAGLAVTIVCALALNTALHWARHRYIGDEVLSAAVAVLGGLWCAATAGALGYLAGRWWWRRAQRHGRLGR